MDNDLSTYIFAKWGKKFHILNDVSDLCCGKVSKRALHLVPHPKDKADICVICWRNRPDWSNDD